MSDADENAKAAPRPEAANDDAGAPKAGGADAAEDKAAAAEAPPAEAGTNGAGAAEESPEEQIAALKDQLLRALAETENVRRRGRRELEDARRYAVAEFARDLLSLADNLERALASARQAGVDDGPLVEGVELTQRQFLQAMEKHGIRPIEAEGQPLDPNLHQAMMQVETDEVPAGTVVQQMQIGYVIHDRLLRPAMVAVAKAPEAPAEAAPAEEAPEGRPPAADC